MAVDVAPVIAALEDAGLAVAAVGLAVLLVCVVIGIWKNLQLIFGVGSSSNLIGSSNDWQVTDPGTGDTYLMGYNEDGSVWEQKLEDSSSGSDSNEALDNGTYGVSREEYDSWDADRQNQYEIDRLNFELNEQSSTTDYYDGYTEEDDRRDRESSGV